MTQDPDQLLVDRARAGDRAALEDLLRLHQDQIYRFTMKMCRDPEDAKDILQDTLFAMARSVRDFRGASSVSTWLYSIARNFCIKKRRKSALAPGVAETSLETELHAEAAALADPAMTPVEAFENKQVEQALERAIAALEQKYREVLVLRDVEGLTAPEVAEVLGVSVQAVKSRLHRARLAVRDRVAPLLGIPMGQTAATATCPDILTVFSRHLEDEISPSVCVEMEQHLASCPRCEGACDSLKRTLALCGTVGSTATVPAAVQKSIKVALRDFLAE